MGSGIATMINNNKLIIDQFFIMHPFAIHERKIYEDALSDVDFFGELFAETNKTFERLSTLCNIIDNHDKNLLVITGYRGCGKTNFVKFVQNLAEGKPVLIPMYEARNYEMHVCNDSEIQKGIKRAYEGSKEKIVNTFFEVKDEIEDILETQQFVEYIQRKVRSKVEYINFDEITLQSSRPIDEALYYRLRRKIYRELQEGDLSRIANTIDIFVTENAWTIEEGFEEIDYESFKQFWFKVRDYLHLISNKNDIGVLFDELKKLKLEQILFAFTVFDYAKMIVDENHGNNQKVIYILDNIDIISDDLSDVFQRSMMGIWKYLWDSRNVFYRIQEDNKSNAFSSIFENTKIIVVMRETTAMHITGHLRDKMRGIMDHFDMSPDINKNLIVQKRLKLAESLIETGKINEKKSSQVLT